MQRHIVVIGLAMSGAIAPAMSALAGGEPYRQGRFTAQGDEVTAGTFDRNVYLESLSFGDVTYEYDRGQLIEPTDIRLAIDPHGTGRFSPIAVPTEHRDEYPVSLAIPFKREGFFNDSGQPGANLKRLVVSDGTADVRLDAFFDRSLIDNAPGEPDTAPEAVVVGDFTPMHSVRIAVIVDGDQDNPVLADEPRLIDPQLFTQGRTEIRISTDIGRTSGPLSIVGLDIHGDLGVEPGTPVIGYRVEVSWGAPAMFTVLGAQLHNSMSSNGLGNEILDDLTDSPIEEFVARSTTGSGLGGTGLGRGVGGPVARGNLLSLGSGGFSGGGGGGGGSRGPIFDGGFDPDNGGSGPDGSDPSPPVVPAPATVPILLAALALHRTRRRR